MSESSPAVQLTLNLALVKRGAVKLGKWLAYWLPFLAVVGGTPVFAALAAKPETHHFTLWVTLAVVCAIVFVVMSETRRHLGARAARHELDRLASEAAAAKETARQLEDEFDALQVYSLDLLAAFNAAFGDLMKCITLELAGLARCSDHEVEGRRGAVLQQLAGAAKTLCGEEDVRAAVYVFDSAKNGRRADLRRRVWIGRGDQPRQVIRRNGNLREQAVHKMVHKGEHHFVQDVRELPESTLYRGKPYKSVIAVAIQAGQDRLGMLTVDAPEPDRFDRTHLGILLALQGLVAIALSLKSGSVGDDVPGQRQLEG